MKNGELKIYNLSMILSFSLLMLLLRNVECHQKQYRTLFDAKKEKEDLCKDVKLESSYMIPEAANDLSAYLKEIVPRTYSDAGDAV
jgi:hypothetical protein